MLDFAATVTIADAITILDDAHTNKQYGCYTADMDKFGQSCMTDNMQNYVAQANLKVLCDNLPTLTGTDKQVSWALQIRKDRLKEAVTIFDKAAKNIDKAPIEIQKTFLPGLSAYFNKMFAADKAATVIDTMRSGLDDDKCYAASMQG